jgi:hypothetical protein
MWENIGCMILFFSFFYILYLMFWPIKVKSVIECKNHQWRVIDDSNWHNRVCKCNLCQKIESFKEPPNGVMFWD